MKRKHRSTGTCRSLRIAHVRGILLIATALMLLYAVMVDASSSKERENNPTMRNRERKRTSNPGEASLVKESYMYNDRISSIQQQISGTASLQFVHKPMNIDDALANFRFDKFSCMKGIDSTRHENLTPLDATSFPIAGEVTQMLQKDTNAISAIDSADDHGIKRSINDLVDLVGGPPLHPKGKENTGTCWKNGTDCRCGHASGIFETNVWQ